MNPHQITNFALSIGLTTLAVLILILFVYMFTKIKSTPEKIQILNVINTMVILIITMYFYYIGKPEYIDIALLYALASYISIMSYSKYYSLSIKREEMEQEETNQQESIKNDN